MEGIKQDLRYMKQDSVNSTRNALRLAREAEEAALRQIEREGLGAEGRAVVPGRRKVVAALRGGAFAPRTTRAGLSLRAPRSRA